MGSGGPHRKEHDFLGWVILSTELTKIIENRERQYARIGQGSPNDTFKYFILFHFFFWNMTFPLALINISLTLEFGKLFIEKEFAYLA